MLNRWVISPCLLCWHHRRPSRVANWREWLRPIVMMVDSTSSNFCVVLLNITVELLTSSKVAFEPQIMLQEERVTWPTRGLALVPVAIGGSAFSIMLCMMIWCIWAFCMSISSTMSEDRHRIKCKQQAYRHVIPMDLVAMFCLRNKTLGGVLFWENNQWQCVRVKCSY